MQVITLLGVGKTFVLLAHPLQRPGEVAQLAEEIGLAVTRAHGNDHRHRHARQRSMDARIIEKSPHHEGRDQEIGDPRLAQTVESVKPCHNGQCEEQKTPFHRTAVEDGDYQDRAQVVDDGQRREEDFERDGHTVAHERQDADGEGDIGGRGYSPAVRRRRAVVEGQIDQRRREHTARRGHDRQDRLARRRKFAADDLSFDFEPHDEEENHHQPVVDELFDVHVAREDQIDHMVGALDQQRQVGAQHVFVVHRRRGQIGQQHRRRHAEHQHRAARPRHAHETPAPFVEPVPLAHPAVPREEFGMILRCTLIAHNSDLRVSPQSL